MKIVLNREDSTKTQTLGHGYVINDFGDSVFTFKTLELPWLDNKTKVSCIPIGKYAVVKIAATKAIPYEHFGLLLVPKRSGICIHAGNYHSDILGCILVGDGYKDLNKDGDLDITNSKKTLLTLLKLLPEKLEIEIS